MCVCSISISSQCSVLTDWPSTVSDIHRNIRFPYIGLWEAHNSHITHHLSHNSHITQITSTYCTTQSPQLTHHTNHKVRHHRYHLNHTSHSLHSSLSSLKSHISLTCKTKSSSSWSSSSKFNSGLSRASTISGSQLGWGPEGRYTVHEVCQTKNSFKSLEPGFFFLEDRIRIVS